MLNKNDQSKPVFYNGVRIRNYTPHPFNLYSQSGELLVSAPSEGDIRAPEEVIGTLLGKDGIPTLVKKYLPILQGDLPDDFDPDKEEILIVSNIVMTVYQGDATGIRCPDSGPDSVVRNKKGHILGVRGLQAKAQS